MILLATLYLPLVMLGAPTAGAPALPALDAFTDQIRDGADQVRGVYAPGRFALLVVQQPAGDPGYVSPAPGVATQFQLPAEVTGLLAHNYLAGVLFFDLAPGDEVVLVQGTGVQRRYRVDQVRRYQVLPDRRYLDLDTGEQLAEIELYHLVYTGGDQVTFQTCIAQGVNATWGLLFVIAQRIGGPYE